MGTTKPLGSLHVIDTENLYQLVPVKIYIYFWMKDEGKHYEPLAVNLCKTIKRIMWQRGQKAFS